jgi:hypothetical protein
MANEQRVITSRLLSKRKRELIWASVINAMNAANTGNQNALLNALRNDQPSNVYRAFRRILDNQLKGEASAEAAAILADSSLTLAELERVFGPF